ncbi:hypothetical protein B484DRAFT_120343 [Ochromonadaceae sp. CCMP2298]|nr:hypothetical protein B484DRAFT_120343 [Ochromonadaceae sp. CCMP2298]
MVWLLALLGLCLWVPATGLIVTDLQGTITYVIDSLFDSSSWTITPSPAASRIQLVFTSIDMNQGSIIIYDGGSDSLNAIFNCASCGSMVPPPFYSSSGTITILATASSGVGFRASSLQLQFIAVPLALTPSVSNLFVQMNMGAASISPLSVGGTVIANSNQRWDIQPSAGAGARITFSFSYFLIGDCSARVRIYNSASDLSSGRVIFEGCAAADMPSGWIYSDTGEASVQLITKSTVAVDFQINYYVDKDQYQCGSFLQESLMTAGSQIIADGTKSTNLMRRGETCSWLLRPLDGQPLSLFMSWVSFKFGSSIVVYDGSSAFSSVLWNAQGATTTVPPVITSSGNTLFVRYRSDSSLSIKYFGFRGDYYSNRQGGSGKGYTELAMSSALDISPPSAHNYTWFVTPQATGPITFALSYLKLQPGDRLTIFNGAKPLSQLMGDSTKISPLAFTSQVIATFTAASPTFPSQWYRTAGNSATIFYEPSASAMEVGNAGESFRLSYHADGPNFHCGFTRNPSSVSAQSFVLTDGSQSAGAVYADQYCEWQVEPSAGRAVVIYFDRFSLFGGSVRIYKGLGTSTLCAVISDSAAVPAPIVVYDSVVTIAYNTSSRATGYGFLLTYYGVTDSRSFPGDGLVRLSSSSVVSLSLPEDSISPNTDLKWLISPSSFTGHVYIALHSLSLSPNCSHNRLDIHDGATTNAPLLARLCGDTVPPSWLRTTSSADAALVHFVSDSTRSEGNFELSYYSDGPTYHCGFVTNPARMSAPSMVFTDGSDSHTALYGAQLCEWVIEPAQDLPTVIVVELLACDLVGAGIEVFDGPSAKAPLLWSCQGCSSIPHRLISSGGAVFVSYTSNKAGPFGAGFKLIYWTSRDAALVQSKPPLTTPMVLQLPTSLALESSLNSTAAFHLPVGAKSAALSVRPFYPEAAPPASLSQTRDGRVSPSEFESLSARPSICGAILADGDSYLLHETVTYRAQQDLRAFLRSSTDHKTLTQLVGTDSSAYAKQSSASALELSGVCKYRLTAPGEAIAITVGQFRPQSQGRLRIYGGLTATDALLFDSQYPYLGNGLVTLVKDSGIVQTASVTAPCGYATVLLDGVDERGNTTIPTQIDFQLDLSYATVPELLPGALCLAYYQSLQPQEKKQDPLLPYYIAAGAVGAFLLLVAIIYNAIKVYAFQGYLLYPSTGGSSARRRRSLYNFATPAYPKQNLKWDNFRNQFLPRGTCVVCNVSNLTIFKLKCGHALCLEDMQGYLESALGDISQFPVKCPMHYQGCEGHIDSKVAKRILSEPQYARFNEFCDRATYGDGMRCIFCANYVNFPEKMENVSRVVCPYCVQHFCVRCKKPWHAGQRCAVDHIDDSLELWKGESGAQKCPACRKLIEKDDPETCNHMIHRITDGQPCVKDRCDFCYCCGEEITGDYPHEEVKKRGVNHFPDGVFNSCRVVIQRAKDVERERLRKLKRMRSKQGNAIGALGRAAAAAPRKAPGTRLGDADLQVAWLEAHYDIESGDDAGDLLGGGNMPGTSVGSLSPARTAPNTPSPARFNNFTPTQYFGGSAAVAPDNSPMDEWDLAAAATGGVNGRPRAMSSGGRRTRAGIVPASPATTASIVGSSGSVSTASLSSQSTSSSPNLSLLGTARQPRPFPMLEQQVLYHQQVLQQRAASTGRGDIRNTYGSNPSFAAHTSNSDNNLRYTASSPQLLVGAPAPAQHPSVDRAARPSRARANSTAGNR